MRTRTGTSTGAGLILVLGWLMGQGCGGGEETARDWNVVSSRDLTPAQEQMKDQATAARDSLFSRLAGRLMKTMKTEGPAAAISICAAEAPRIAAEVSEEHHLSIGRTSFRLRNPKNTAPDWATALVASQVEEETCLEGPGGELGVLLPIRMNRLCVTCHGGSEEIPAVVKEALAQNYPEDAAIGFAPGDLRGWFWVEVKP